MLKIKNIEVVYNEVVLVIKGLSMEVNKGEIVSLLGANGAGKSTTLKSISGLLKTEDGETTKGNILFEGKEITKSNPSDIVKNGIFQVMEGRRCIADMTIEENLRLGAHTRSDRKNIKVDIEEVMNFFLGLFTCGSGKSSGVEVVKGTKEEKSAVAQVCQSAAWYKSFFLIISAFANAGGQLSGPVHKARPMLEKITMPEVMRAGFLSVIGLCSGIISFLPNIKAVHNALTAKFSFSGNNNNSSATAVAPPAAARPPAPAVTAFLNKLFIIVLLIS